MLLPTMGSLEPSAQTTAAPAAAEPDEAGDEEDSATPEGAAELSIEVHTNVPKIMEPETPAPVPARGDGPNNIPQVKPTMRTRLETILP